MKQPIMQTVTSELDEQLLAGALEAAGDTRTLLVDAGARHRAQQVFEAEFGSARAIVVADRNTFDAAGREVVDSFAHGSHDSDSPFIFGPHIYAEYSCVEELARKLHSTDAIPVAVGSGTVNDLTKLVAHQLHRPYMVVATAASMDGYTAYGASITHQGSKQTFDCPAPRAVIADLDVVAAAPTGMNASGYADLFAKSAAGGDWILADAAGEEPIHGPTWDAVQGRLRAWLSAPEAVAAGDPASLRHLVYGLMMTGFAMQSLRSSRPASGADHQFSHLWDMQHHTHRGAAPSHGFKVGIGTLASLALYDEILQRNVAAIDIDDAIRRWPSLAEIEGRIGAVLGGGELAAKAVKETRAKHIDRDALRLQLIRLRDEWPGLAARLRAHLPRCAEARDMLRAAGCPFEPEAIGISRERLRLSYEQAWYIRRRYTVLDFAQRAGIAGEALDCIFGPSGPWPIPAKGEER
ncbi:MAG: glycerol dehydrogenase-like oxidoreductase [Candidatus Solibacter sp.]|nr:glycerol dehydrogenase-like oxidoreductase [Candidatus Solibacter sp.]